MNEKAVRPAPSREETLDEVLKLARLGLRLHPVAARDKVPILSSWPTRATTDERTIRLWASQYDNCNFGVATGEASGVLVLDVDPKHGGNDSLELLKAEHGLPETWLAKTGSGGFHYYFAYPKGKEIRNSSNKIGRGLDIRATNGQVLVPPSIHPNGTPYEWINHPSTTKLAKAPAWLLKMILEDEGAKYSPLGGKLEVGSRNNQIYHQALALARQGAEKDFIVAALEKWLADQHHPDVTRDEVEKTVDSAIKAARVKPIDIEDRSDTLNAELLLQNHGENLIYVPGMGWHVYDGRVWVPDYEEAQVKQLYISTMRKLQEDAAARVASSRSKTEMKEAAAVAAWAVRSLSARAIAAALSIAKTYPQVRKTVDEIDGVGTLWLLACQNGVVDLRTGELRPHRKEDYITKLVPVDYDPEAKAPFWESTLELAFSGNKELIGYMQRALGYTITGTQDERAFFVAWGESGANGKSTILETIQDLLGPYAKMSDMSVIASKESNNHTRAALATLQGARFVNVNEAEDNQKLSEALIKQLTGGDTLQAEFKYQNPFEYKPAFKLWIRTNEKPVIRGQNDAIWDRVKLIPFIRSIPKDQRLPRSTVDAKLREEYPGILAWLVRGCLWWQEVGLMDPPEVASAVAEYRKDSDLVRIFADECLEIAPSFTLSASSAYQAYSAWCKEGGERYVMTKTRFTQRMKALGYEAERGRAGTRFRGVRLSDSAGAFMV